MFGDVDCVDDVHLFFCMCICAMSLQCEERETIYECPLLITHGSMRITHSSAAKISGNVFL